MFTALRLDNRINLEHYSRRSQRVNQRKFRTVCNLMLSDFGNGASQPHICIIISLTCIKCNIENVILGPRHHNIEYYHKLGRHIFFWWPLKIEINSKLSQVHVLIFLMEAVILKFPSQPYFMLIGYKFNYFFAVFSNEDKIKLSRYLNFYKIFNCFEEHLIF